MARGTAIDRVNAGAGRFTATKDALRYLDRYYVPDGKLDIPTITLHTTRDPLVPFAGPLMPAARYGFALGLPDAALFPFAIWRRLSSRALRNIAKVRAAYSQPSGQPELRELLDRTELRQNVDAVAVVLDHPRDAAHLTLDPGKPLEEQFLVLRVAGGGVLGGGHVRRAVVYPREV